MMTDISIANPVVHLRDEYERQRALFHAQPTIIQRFFESQAQHLAEAVTNDSRQVRFTLPDRVTAKVPQSGEMAEMLVPAQMREQTLGRWQLRYTGHYLRDELRLRLSELEQSPDQSITASASLLRYTATLHMVHNMLPSGRSVTYRAESDEQIPSIPEQMNGELESALTSAGDAIVEHDLTESGRGELVVPFVPAARRFYLPQWVAFDDQGKLLVNSINEAEANQASMERFLTILHTASSLATYIVVDETYQQKRYGMLGQTINQGRALARYMTEQIIKNIQQRVRNGTLNRGLSISLPYYDDQELHMAEVLLEAIPAGRIMFKSIFVVRAARIEHAKVSQDTRLSPSTRKNLLRELDMLETAFNNFREQAIR
jgi:hypothetical protein